MTYRYFRPAIAMIELIFAIVIMGIVMMSAPMLISTASTSTPVILQQEGISQAVTRITMMLSYPWDEATDTNDSCIEPVLIVTNGDSELQPMASDSSRRVGIPLESSTRKFNTCGEDLNATIIGADTGDVGYDDMDDFSGGGLSEIQGAGGRYIGKDTVSMTTTVTYGSDVADYTASTITFTPGVGTASSNIKNIAVTVNTFSTVSELSSTITMNVFSCNTGGIAYETRTLP